MQMGNLLRPWVWTLPTPLGINTHPDVCSYHSYAVFQGCTFHLLRTSPTQSFLTVCRHLPTRLASRLSHPPPNPLRRMNRPSVHSEPSDGFSACIIKQNASSAAFKCQESLQRHCLGDSLAEGVNKGCISLSYTWLES